MAADGAKQVLASGPWEIDLRARELRCRGVAVPIGGRAFEIMAVLAAAAGALISKNELMQRVWPDTVVGESTLHVHVSALRKALGQDRHLLQTTSGRGYRLIGAWSGHREAPVPAPAAHSGNLPARVAALIGRDPAVRELRALLAARRAVTLAGPGGIGKTALALEVARRLRDEQGKDAWLIELASLADPGLVATAAASALGLKLGGDAISAEAVARAIGAAPWLLVVDNCEHVVAAAATLVDAVLHRCPNATVLATSREALRIEGEQVYRVPPLDVPPVSAGDAGSILEHSAVQLLIARARAQHADVPIDGDSTLAMGAICRRLDGIPLAIEFAGARTAALGAGEVAARLDDRFGLLTAGLRTALPRHQTLRATLDWSYELLSDAEQLLLRRVAIFPAGFTLDAAVAVVSEAGTDASVALEGIANLVEKSLAALDDTTTEPRWRLLETIRAYALERLREAGEHAAAARRHAQFFRERFAPERSEVAAWGLREIDNVRAALDWAFSPDGDAPTGIALTAGYVPVWMHLALVAECRARIERALAALEPVTTETLALRMRLQIALGIALVITMGPVEQNRTALTAALAAAERLADRDAELRAAWSLWALEFNIGDCGKAHAVADRVSRIAQRLGDAGATAVADRILGYTLHLEGNQPEARRCFERVLAAPRGGSQRHRFLYDQHLLARAMLARTLWLQGLLDQAEATAQASLADAGATGDNLTFCFVLSQVVCPVALLSGDPPAAARSVASLLEVATRHGFNQYGMVGDCLEGMLMIGGGELVAGATRLRAAIERGEAAGWTASHPMYLGVLADGLAGLGQRTAALAVLEQALAKAERSGERWYQPELLRRQGAWQVPAGAAPGAAAEACLQQALDLARRQGALLWELRAALVLARWRIEQDRADEAQRLLAPIHARFTEGHAMPDLRAARALLHMRE